MVALVGRELYESSKSTKPECPMCKMYDKIILTSPSLNQTDWDNGPCAKTKDNPFVAGFTYIFKSEEACCSLEMLRYKDPSIIWVRRSDEKIDI